jgi:hypothetical protein
VKNSAPNAITDAANTNTSSLDSKTGGSMRVCKKFSPLSYGNCRKKTLGNASKKYEINFGIKLCVPKFFMVNIANQINLV